MINSNLETHYGSLLMTNDELDLDAMEARCKKHINDFAEFGLVDNWAVDVPRLIAEVRKLQEALEFYGNPDIYIHWPIENESAIYRDQGRLARVASKAISEKYD